MKRYSRFQKTETDCARDKRKGWKLDVLFVGSFIYEVVTL